MPKLGGFKFKHSEKPTKFEKNLSHGFDKSADLRRIFVSGFKAKHCRNVLGRVLGQKN